MKIAYLLLAVSAALRLSATADAQSVGLAGTTPGAGMATVDMTGAPTLGPAMARPGAGLQNPQPAECLSQPAGPDGPWGVIAPYAWVFSLKGMVGAGPRTAAADVSLSDAVGALDDLRGAAQLHVESGYGDIGVIADLTYLRLVPVDRLVTVEMRTTIFELLGMYRVVDTGRRAGGVTFDVLAGARYYRFSNRVEGNVLGLLSAERTDDWFDLVVGARTGVQLTDDLGVFARGDVGGFGLGRSSERACNIAVGFEYRCCDCASLIGGYRWLKIDRESGFGRDRFLIDATLSGPFAAFALRY